MCSPTLAAHRREHELASSTAPVTRSCAAIVAAAFDDSPLPNRANERIEIELPNSPQSATDMDPSVSMLDWQTAASAVREPPTDNAAASVESHETPNPCPENNEPLADRHLPINVCRRTDNEDPSVVSLATCSPPDVAIRSDADSELPSRAYDLSDILLSNVSASEADSWDPICANSDSEVRLPSRATPLTDTGPLRKVESEIDADDPPTS